MQVGKIIQVEAHSDSGVIDIEVEHTPTESLQFTLYSPSKVNSLLRLTGNSLLITQPNGMGEEEFEFITPPASCISLDHHTLINKPIPYKFNSNTKQYTLVLPTKRIYRTILRMYSVLKNH